MAGYKLSVIVVSWNTRDLVNRCLASVYRHLAPRLELELIVVDNASTDNTARMIREQYPQIVLLENTINIGFAPAVNQAAAESSGDYLLLLNSDAELLDSGITDILKGMDKYRDIGVATGRMVDDKGKKIPPYYRFPRFADLIKSYSVDRVKKIGRPLRGKVRGRVNDDHDIPIYEVDWVSGGYLVVRNELIQPDGLFDNRIFMYYEDVLLCRRAWDSGYRVVYMDCAAVKHALGASAKKVRVEAVRYSYESSRHYICTVYGTRVLRRYETLNRWIWRLVLGMMAIGQRLGMKQQVAPKQALFKRLLSVERIS